MLHTHRQKTKKLIIKLKQSRTYNKLRLYDSFLVFFRIYLFLFVRELEGEIILYYTRIQNIFN